MMDELVCGLTHIDLNGEMPIPINFSIADVKDPSKRKRNFSKEIELPGTSSNIEFMRNVFSFTSTESAVNFDPTKKVSAVYSKRGVPVLPSAVLMLKEVVIQDGEPTFTVNLYSETVDYFLLLSQVSVSELDWSEYDHVLSRANIKASWLTPSGSGYRYPLIDRGSPRPGATIFNTTDLLPYVHLREAFLKSLAWAGFTVNSQFIESTRFKNILFGFGGGDLPSIPANDLDQRKIDINSGLIDIERTRVSQQYNVQGPASSIAASTSFSLPSFNPFDASMFNYTAASDDLSQFGSDGDITIQKSGNYSLSIVLQINAAYDVGTMTFSAAGGMSLQIRKNGAFVSAIADATILSTDTGSFNLSGSINIYANSGDVISFNMILGSASVILAAGEVAQPITLQVTNSTDITIDMNCNDSTITDGGTVQLGRFLPAMKCSDLVLGCIRQFNLYTSDPDRTGAIDCEPLADFYTVTNVFTDITQLVDHSQAIKVRPAANEYAKNIIFKFKEIKDYDALKYSEKWGEPYGDLNYEQGSYFAKGEMNIELPWGTIVPWQLNQGMLIPRFIKIDDNGTVSPNSGPARIMMWNGMKPGAWTFRNTDNPTSQEQLNEYPCVHHFDNWQYPDFDLNFKLVSEVLYAATTVTTINSYSEYYSEFINEMTNPAGKLVNVFVKWTSRDIRNLNFGKLLMINGALFRLNEIMDFDDEKQASCETELVKVLRAKKASRIKAPPKKPAAPTIDVGIISSPSGVGEDTGVIIGGKPGSVSQNSNVIKG